MPHRGGTLDRERCARLESGDNVLCPENVSAAKSSLAGTTVTWEHMASFHAVTSAFAWDVFLLLTRACTHHTHMLRQHTPHSDTLTTHTLSHITDIYNTPLHTLHTYTHHTQILSHHMTRPLLTLTHITHIHTTHTCQPPHATCTYTHTHTHLTHLFSPSV